MRTSKLTTYLVLILTTVLAVGCAQQNSSVENDAAADSIIRPDTEVFGATIYLYERDRVVAEIEAERIVKFESLDSTMTYDLKVQFYDSLGVKASTVVGDSGIVREATGYLKVYDHVVVNTEDKVLETDSLVWDPDIERIRTDAFVKIIREDGTLSGWGLDATKDLSRLTILHNVTSTKLDVPEDALEDEQ